MSQPTQTLTRRAQILATAAELFAARGFHGVSVADIGAACGVSGPALYKHFPGKDALLAEMLVSISEHLLAGAQARGTLAELVDFHVDFALRHRSLIIVQDRDWSTLPPAARERVRSLQREYVDVWADRIRSLHPHLSLAEARAMAHATFGLINSTPHSALLPDPAMRALLVTMSLRSLGVAGQE